MIIREIEQKDAEKYLAMLKKLDYETKFMMYEAGERTTTISEIRQEITDLNDLQSLQLVIEDRKKIVGYLTAERGFANRIKHNVYITVGILKEYRGKGLGVKLFNRLNEWAKTNNIVRLELTVMKHNIAGIRLYEKMGFKIEGLKEKSLIVEGEFVDEYYMAKIMEN